jgi:hypothetical protein
MRALLRSAKQVGMFCMIAALLLCGSLYMLGYPSFAWGLFIGMMGGLGFLGLLVYQLKKNMDAPPVDAVAELQSGWVERALYMGVVCLVAWFIPGVHFGGVLIGLLGLHVAVFIWGLVNLAKSKSGKYI